jgi:hypothetical protein
MSFLSGLFGGSNPTLNNQIGQLGQVAGNATKQGESDTTDASNFFHSLLSGNGMKALAPQVAGIKGQGQQQLQSLSQFGNRSGGTNAAGQQSQDKTRASINDMITSLTGSAASNLGSLGSNLLSTGLSAFGQQRDASQQQLQNWQSSIFGQGISSGLGYLEGFGLGKIPGQGQQQ